MYTGLFAHLAHVSLRRDVWLTCHHHVDRAAVVAQLAGDDVPVAEVPGDQNRSASLLQRFGEWIALAQVQRHRRRMWPILFDRFRQAVCEGTEHTQGGQPHRPRIRRNDDVPHVGERAPPHAPDKDEDDGGKHRR